MQDFVGAVVVVSNNLDRVLHRVRTIAFNTITAQMFQSFRKPLAQHEMPPTRGHRLGIFL